MISSDLGHEMIDRFLSYSCAKAKAVVPPMLGLALPRRFATDFLGVGSRPELSGFGGDNSTPI